jgi:hypothetical protein
VKKFMGERYVNKEREVQEFEIVKPEQYATDIRRYANSILEDTEGLPVSFTELDEIAARTLINFLNNTINPYTNKSTFGNITESYMISGAYTDEYLKKHSKHTVVENERGDIQKETYEFDHREYAKIQIKALNMWQKKKLDVVMNDYKALRYGKIEPKDIIENAILSGITGSNNEKEKIDYIKLGIKVFGLDKNAGSQPINVYVDGGGKELTKSIVSSTGNSNFDLGLDKITIDAEFEETGGDKNGNE